MPTFVHAWTSYRLAIRGSYAWETKLGLTPRHTGGVSLILRPLERTTLVGGLTYVA